MHVSYGCLGKRLSFFPKRLMVMVGLLTLPITMRLEKVASAKPMPSPIKPPPPSPSDSRTVRLQKFLSRLHCPVTYLADDFVHAADDNHLDWRLLPSISVIESGGGKAYRNNNIFGWKNGDQAFPTLRASIHEVAFKLGKSPLYRNRDVPEKLRLYNPDPDYVGAVMNVMRRISPVVNLQPVRRLIRRPNEFVYVTD